MPGFHLLTSAGLCLMPVLRGCVLGLRSCPEPPEDAAHHLRALSSVRREGRPAALIYLFHLRKPPVGLRFSVWLQEESF